MKSKNRIVANALNAMSDEEFDERVEKAFDTAVISSLQSIEKALLELEKTQAHASQIYNRKSMEFKNNYKALLGELSYVRAMIRHLR